MFVTTDPSSKLKPPRRAEKQSSDKTKAAGQDEEPPAGNAFLAEKPYEAEKDG